MKKAFLKELKLDVMWVVYLFPLLALFTCIPNYPIIVGMGYSVLATFIYFQYKREFHALEFEATLPIKRSHMVTAAALVVVLVQMAFLLVGAIGAVISKFVFPQGNIVGIDPNLTFFGITLMCFAACNVTFLPYHYKNVQKIGFPKLAGLAAFLAVYGACEALIQAIPLLYDTLDGYDTATLWARFLVLAVGAIVYVFVTAIAVALAKRNFQKVNL